MDEPGPRGLEESTRKTNPHPGLTRRLTLADLLILVAAAGVALLVVRLELQEEQGLTRSRFIVMGRYSPTIVLRTIPFLVAVGPALLIMRLRHPRLARRRIFRQPGTAVCLAVTFSGSLYVLVRVVIVASVPMMNPVSYCVSGLERLGSPVMLAWLTLALAGVWRPAPDWIDRSGRVLGVILIVLYVLSVSMFSRQ
jgi:hypothetical protein